MTDEELAKGWVTDNTGFNPKESLGKIAVQTFLAGLKAGKDMAETDLATIAYMQGAERYKPKWHDLMEDPNDLPAKRQHVLCYTSDPWCHNQKGLKNVKHCDVEMGTYMGTGEWYIGCYHTYAPPKAWCEIPKFIDKE